MPNDMVFDPKIKEYIPRDEYQFYTQHEKILESKSLTTEVKKEYLQASLGLNVTSFDDDSFPSKSFDIRNPDGSLITEYRINSNNDYSNCINELIEEEKYWGFALEIAYHFKKRLITGEWQQARGEREPITR